MLNNGWADLGANAHIWGGVSDQPTCQANGSCKPTRRDYILAGVSLLQHVDGFRVIRMDAIPTHEPVQVSPNMNRMEEPKRAVAYPNSIYEAAHNKIEEAGGKWRNPNKLPKLRRNS